MYLYTMFTKLTPHGLNLHLKAISYAVKYGNFVVYYTPDLVVVAEEIMFLLLFVCLLAG